MTNLFDIESFYQFMEENNGDDFFNIPVDKKPKCAICGSEAEIEVSGAGPIPENVCMRCYAHPDYQVIVFRDNLKRKLI